LTRSRPETDLFDLATYLVASARDCVDEPLIYGPLRMLDGVSKIAQITGGDPRLRDSFLSKMGPRISADVLKVMSDREKFKKALDDLLLEFTDELERRTVKERRGIRGGPSRQRSLHRGHRREERVPLV